MRPAVVLGVLQGGVELLGRHRDAQRGEVGEDLVTRVWGRSLVVGLRAVFLRRGLHRSVSSGESKC